MDPVRIFVSHRAEYASVAHDLKEAIETASQIREPKAGTETSQRPVDVFLSEGISHGDQWLPAIKEHLREAKALILIYGAPYEDWSWCFYEAGYFAAVDPGASGRRIYCIVRPTIPIPGPVGDLQAVKGKDDLIRALTDIYVLNGIDFDAGKLRAVVARLESRLFGELRELEGYWRFHLTAEDAGFGANGEIPADAVLTGDAKVLGDLFGFTSNSVPWADVVEAAHKPAAAENFVPKWIDETETIILAARKNQFFSPQTVLIGRAGQRYRTVLHHARIQGDGTYRCEFLAIGEVGGPAVGLTSQQLSLLTSIRMGFRFRSEVIQKFRNNLSTQSDEQRRARIQQIPRIIDDLTTESRTRGDIKWDELLTAFDRVEGERMQKLMDYWQIVERELYRSLGLSADGKTKTHEGLLGSDLERYGDVMEALRLLNLEFLSRCCARVSQMMKMDKKALSESSELLEQAMKKLTRPRKGRRAPARTISTRPAGRFPSDHLAL